MVAISKAREPRASCPVSSLMDEIFPCWSYSVGFTAGERAKMPKFKVTRRRPRRRWRKAKFSLGNFHLASERKRARAQAHTRSRRLTKQTDAWPAGRPANGNKWPATRRRRLRAADWRREKIRRSTSSQLALWAELAGCCCCCWYVAWRRCAVRL